MKCVICKQGGAHPGRVNVTLQRGGCIVIVKDVPGDACENCGEYYLSAETTRAVLGRAEGAAKNGAEFEMVVHAA